MTQPIAQLLKVSTIIQALNSILEDADLGYQIQRIFTENNPYPAIILENYTKSISSSKAARPNVTLTMNFKIIDQSRNFNELESLTSNLYSLFHQTNEDLLAKLPTNTRIISLEVISIAGDYTINTKDSLLTSSFTLVFQCQKN